jgi:DNA-binding LacI/PurR family transcriptional regulator
MSPQFSASNDQMALGVTHAFHESGLDVPADISVIGFDDIPEAAYFWPPLTTVRQDFAELARRCVARLVGDSVPAQVQLGPLHHRWSSAHPLARRAAHDQGSKQILRKCLTGATELELTVTGHR